MKVLGIRFCKVGKEAKDIAAFLGPDGLGLKPRDVPAPPVPDTFSGAIFPAGEDSWVELWKPTEDMPAGTMLQIVVDDADAFAAHARKNGLEPKGPTDAHGERIYFLWAPGGLRVSFQSRLEE